MYSRKFNGIHTLPPDYGGVALRRESETDKEQRNKDPNQSRDENDQYGTYPRYPVYENEREQEPKDEHICQKPQADQKNERGGWGNALSSLSKKSFSLEDIVLAGLILLIMNEDEKDDGLLLILGFLLLIGMK